MNWADLSSAAGTMFPGLAVTTVAGVVVMVAALGRFAVALRRLFR